MLIYRKEELLQNVIFGLIKISAEVEIPREGIRAGAGGSSFANTSFSSESNNSFIHNSFVFSSGNSKLKKSNSNSFLTDSVCFIL